MSVDITINDNSESVKQELDNAILRALERMGMQAEGYAVDLVPVDTGALRNSLTHKHIAVSADFNTRLGVLKSANMLV